jgi:glycosyltransferase 2 family protein
LARVDKKIFRIAFLVLKIGVSSALLAYLFSKVGGMAVIGNALLLSPFHIAAASALYVLASFISTLRWQMFVPQQPGRRALFSLYMIGTFFNVCLPSTIGGDAVKAYYLSRQLKKNAGKNGEGQFESNYNVISVASVFMDRYVGLSALLFIGLVAFPFGYGILERTAILWTMPIIFLVFAVSSIVLFKFRIGTRLKIMATLHDYFEHYFRKREVLFKGFLYSIVIQLLAIFTVYILALGMGLDIPFLTFIVFLPIIFLVTLIPVSISGIGLREGAFVLLFSITGLSPDKAMTLSLIWFISVVIGSLWGLVEYLRFKHLFGGSIKEDSF